MQDKMMILHMVAHYCVNWPFAFHIKLRVKVISKQSYWMFVWKIPVGREIQHHIICFTLNLFFLFSLHIVDSLLLQFVIQICFELEVVLGWKLQTILSVWFISNMKLFVEIFNSEKCSKFYLPDMTASNDTSASIFPTACQIYLMRLTRLYSLPVDLVHQPNQFRGGFQLSWFR